MMPTAEDVAAFLGRPGDAATVAAATETLPLVTALVRAYTRGVGFHGTEATDDLAAVITTATARLMANPGQLATTLASGPFTKSVSAGFAGWTLAELYVLNRYRTRAS